MTQTTAGPASDQRTASAPMLWRGVAVQFPSADEYWAFRDAPAQDQAQTLLRMVEDRRFNPHTDGVHPHGAGVHWSTDDWVASSWANSRIGFNPNLVAVVLGIEHPGDKHVQTDPKWLVEHGVAQYSGGDEKEVPLLTGAPIPVVEVRWHFDDQDNWRVQRVGRHLLTAAKTAGPSSNHIPDRLRSHDRVTPAVLHEPRPVVLDRPAEHDLKDLPGDVRKRLMVALDAVEHGNAAMEPKTRELVGTFGVRLTRSWRALFYLGAEKFWHLFAITDHDYAEVTRRWASVQIETSLHTASVEEVIRRGLTWALDESPQSLALAKKAEAGTLTAGEIIDALEPLGVWWGLESQYGGLSEYEAHAEQNFGVPVHVALKEMREEMAAGFRGQQEIENWFGGDIAVVLTAKRPQHESGAPWDPAVHNEPGTLWEGNSYLPKGQPLEIVEVRYDAGDGYHVLRANGIRTTADVVDYKAERPLTGPDARPITSLMPGTSLDSHNDVPFADALDDAMGTDRHTPDVGGYLKARKAWWRSQPVTQISLRTPFVITQANVNLPRVHQMIEHPETAGSEPIWMVRHGGRLYTLNGHHRLVAEFLKGAATIEARVVDSSALKKQAVAEPYPDTYFQHFRGPLVIGYVSDEEWESSPVAEISTRDLIATQTSMDRGTLEDYAQQQPSQWPRLPRVFEYQGERYIEDGHHRIADQIDKGATTVKVHLVHLPRAAKKQALPSWRDRGEHPEAEALIVPDTGRGRRNSYSVYLYGQPHASRGSLSDAKAVVEEIYGPLDWKRLSGDEKEHHDRVWGPTTMFNDAPYYLCVERLPRLGTTAAVDGLTISHRRDEQRERDEVVAFVRGERVGYLAWGEGVVANVQIEPSWRRKGIATALLGAAREIDPDIQHDWYGSMTPDGEAWAKRVAHLATAVSVPGLLIEEEWDLPVIGPRQRAVAARVNGRLVGGLVWDTEDGIIDYVQVDPDLRRRGIATALLLAARGLDPKVRHDVEEKRSDLGKAWVRSLSAIAKSKDTNVSPSEHGDARLQDAGVSVKKTKDGKYYVCTHRARGKYRDSVADIPDSEIEFIRSTGSAATWRRHRQGWLSPDGQWFLMRGARMSTGGTNSWMVHRQVDLSEVGLDDGLPYLKRNGDPVVEIEGHLYHHESDAGTFEEAKMNTRTASMTKQAEYDAHGLSDDYRLVRDYNTNNVHLAKEVNGELRALCNARYVVWDYHTIGWDRDHGEQVWSWGSCSRCLASAAKGNGLKQAALVKRADEDQCPYDASDSLADPEVRGGYVCEQGHQWRPDDPAAKIFHEGPGIIQPLASQPGIYYHVTSYANWPDIRANGLRGGHDGHVWLFTKADAAMLFKDAWSGGQWRDDVPPERWKVPPCIVVVRTDRAVPTNAGIPGAYWVEGGVTKGEIFEVIRPADLKHYSSRTAAMVHCETCDVDYAIDSEADKHKHGNRLEQVRDAAQAYADSLPRCSGCGAAYHPDEIEGELHDHWTAKTATNAKVQRLWGAGFDGLYPYASKAHPEQGRVSAALPYSSVLYQQRPWDKQAVEDQTRPSVRRFDLFDPRELVATQSGITRDGVRHYMSDKYDHTGEVYAKNDPNNEYPVVYVDPDGTHRILVGHHRAVASLLKGKMFRAIRVEAPDAPAGHTHAVRWRAAARIDAVLDGPRGREDRPGGRDRGAAAGLVGRGAEGGRGDHRVQGASDGAGGLGPALASTPFLHLVTDEAIDKKPMDGFEDKASYDWVHPQIATGGAIRYATDLRQLQRKGVVAIVSGRRDFEDSLLAEGREMGIAFLSNPTPDDGGPKPTEWFRRAIDFCLPYLRSGQRVYVHCHAGMNRGPSLAYAVLRAYTGMGHEQAQRAIQSQRTYAPIAYMADADRALHELGYTRETTPGIQSGTFHTLTGGLS